MASWLRCLIERWLDDRKGMSGNARLRARDSRAAGSPMRAMMEVTIRPDLGEPRHPGLVPDAAVVDALKRAISADDFTVRDEFVDHIVGADLVEVAVLQIVEGIDGNVLFFLGKDEIIGTNDRLRDGSLQPFLCDAVIEQEGLATDKEDIGNVGVFIQFCGDPADKHIVRSWLDLFGLTTRLTDNISESRCRFFSVLKKLDLHGLHRDIPFLKSDEERASR